MELNQEYIEWYIYKLRKYFVTWKSTVVRSLRASVSYFLWYRRRLYADCVYKDYMTKSPQRTLFLSDVVGITPALRAINCSDNSSKDVIPGLINVVPTKKKNRLDYERSSLFPQSHGGEPKKLFFLWLGLRPSSSRFCRWPPACTFGFRVTQKKNKKIEIIQINVTPRSISNGSFIIPKAFMNILALMAPKNM